VKLKKLLKNIPVKEIKGSIEIEIAGLSSHSKTVSPGSLFIARKGKSDDGEKYIPEALSAGAVAIVTDIANPSLKNVTQIIHPNVTVIEGLLAANYYQMPSDELFTVGITGTNGKTTTSFLVKHLLDHLKAKSGLIGTIEYVIGEHRYPATRTTPDVIQNHKMLREMVLQGCKGAVMEVSSHALDQKRVEYIDFNAVVFTNLSLDHLDYHETMDLYAAAKNKLFTSVNQNSEKKKTAIVNSDSPWVNKILQGCFTPVIGYAIENEADVRAKNICLSPHETRFEICYQGKRFSATSPLIGRYNVYNYLAALSVGVAKGASVEKLIEILSKSPPVPGRLEFVPNPLSRSIYVDFAHSDDALENVLKALREFKKGRIITVFGCGGDRDRNKRPKMAEISEKYSDITIVTSDNPRTENPETIFKDILGGFKDKNSYMVEPDRYLAIKRAIDLSDANDMILIAGKGHEAYQIFAHKTIEFDDRKIAHEIAQKKMEVNV
jgi:UDP-N-acetylmuramoyl-L-alanyl-D-glutamate--2,6-diaminopimelate ligase